jgi:hypothetical protein
MLNTALLQELRFIFPALPLLTMAGGVGLDRILPADSSSLLYPLNLLHPDPHTNKMKKLDRQRLLTIPYYRVYRYMTRSAGCYFKASSVSEVAQLTPSVVGLLFNAVRRPWRHLPV